MLRIALGQYDTAWHEPEISLQRAAEIVHRAAESGAALVLLPEMCTTGFIMDPSRFSEAIDGASAHALAGIARDSSVHLLAGIATRVQEGEEERYYNSAVLFDPTGAMVAEYRKQRLFTYAREHDSYSAGNQSVIAVINGVRVGILICFDLRFPELFQSLAPYSDVIALIANWPITRQHHWDTLLRARAIDSQCYVAGVNRTGVGGKLEYKGGSIIYDAWGEAVVASSEEDIAIATIDPDTITKTRQSFPMVTDRRGDVPDSGLRL